MRDGEKSGSGSGLGYRMESVGSTLIRVQWGKIGGRESVQFCMDWVWDCKRARDIYWNSSLERAIFLFYVFRLRTVFKLHIDFELCTVEEPERA